MKYLEGKLIILKKAIKENPSKTWFVIAFIIISPFVIAIIRKSLDIENFNYIQMIIELSLYFGIIFCGLYYIIYKLKEPAKQKSLSINEQRELLREYCRTCDSMNRIDAFNSVGKQSDESVTLMLQEADIIDKDIFKKNDPKDVCDKNTSDKINERFPIYNRNNNLVNSSNNIIVNS